METLQISLRILHPKHDNFIFEKYVLSSSLTLQSNKEKVTHFIFLLQEHFSTPLFLLNNIVHFL
jgi:hypothetical protein